MLTEDAKKILRMLRSVLERWVSIDTLSDVLRGYSLDEIRNALSDLMRVYNIECSMDNGEYYRLMGHPAPLPSWANELRPEFKDN